MLDLHISLHGKQAIDGIPESMTSDVPSRSGGHSRATGFSVPSVDDLFS